MEGVRAATGCHQASSEWGGRCVGCGEESHIIAVPRQGYAVLVQVNIEGPVSCRRAVAGRWASFYDIVHRGNAVQWPGMNQGAGGPGRGWAGSVAPVSKGEMGLWCGSKCE